MLHKPERGSLFARAGPTSLVSSTPARFLRSSFPARPTVWDFPHQDHLNGHLLFIHRRSLCLLHPLPRPPEPPVVEVMVHFKAEASFAFSQRGGHGWQNSLTEKLLYRDVLIGSLCALCYERPQFECRDNRKPTHRWTRERNGLCHETSKRQQVCHSWDWVPK